MKFLRFKNLVSSWKHLVALLVIAMGISSSVLLFPSNHPANAIFGVADATITLIDLKNFAEDLLETFAEDLVEGVVKQESSQLINSTIKQYHIGSYLQYAVNLKNQVFAAQAIAGDKVAGQSQLNEYIVRSIISDIDNNPVSRVNIDPLYAKAALDAFNLQDTSSVTIGSGAQNYMGKAGGFSANPGGQYFLFVDLSQKINSKASLAAQQDISTASGNKSTFDCTQAALSTGEALTADNGLGLKDSFKQGSDNGDVAGQGSAAATNNSQVSCALQNPGSYVGNVLAGNVQGLFNRQVDPPNNHLGAILSSLAGALGGAFANIAQQQLIGGSKGGTLVSATIPVNTSSGNGSATAGASGSSQNASTSTANATGTNNIGSQSSDALGFGDNPGDTSGSGSGNSGIPGCPGCVQGASDSNFGTFYALDASGNVIAGSGTSVSQPVAKKSAITLEWNAAAISGAHYVAFAPCATAQCSGVKDKKDLDGSLAAKAPNSAVQTYTLQVWGMDAFGNLTILETDSIAVKTK